MQTMSKEKQNENLIQMYRDLGEIFNEEYEKRRLIPPQNTAEKMTAKGYRKQREGEWQIKSEIYKLIDDVDEELYVECPFCKRRFPVPYEFDDEKIFKYAREHYPYCNCGAKMKGGAE